MKRMSLTLSNGLTLLGKSTFLLIFALCIGGLQNLAAQVTISYDSKGKNTCTVETLASCNGEVTDKGTQFTDDGTNDGNYADIRSRLDTVEFCPTDRWHYVKVIFNKFDLENPATGTGDTLLAYQGNKAAVRNGLMPVDKATGTGVSSAYGGWIYAECDPAINESGCLTFLLKTDGDNAKGAGWDAWVDCADRDIKFEAANIPSVKLECDDSPWAIIEIPAPTVTGCGSTAISDSVYVRVKNQHGVICIDECISKNGLGSLATSVMDTFALGSYSVTYKLKSDTTKTNTQVFSVQAPSLVCNDDINVPLGSACMIVLTPDDILEQPCDTIQDTMYYNITVTLGEGKSKQTLITTGYNSGGKVVYPVVTVEDVKKAGMKVCDAKATVRIERVYYGRLVDNTGKSTLSICNNGTKTNACETILNFSDQSVPWVSVVPGIDTLIACDTTGLARILEAKAIDNCDDDLAITYAVRMHETDPCFASLGSPDTTTATVTFSATDDCGNVGTFEKDYTIIRPNRTDHIVKTQNVVTDCSEIQSGISSVPVLAIGTYKNGQFTVRDTIRLSTEEYICGYILTKRSEYLPSTDCGTKTYRYWSVLDWCQPELGPMVVDRTYIESVDTVAPKFVDEKAPTLHLELGHFSCEFDITKIEKPAAADNCDDNPAVRLDMVSRIEDGQIWPITDLSHWTKLDCDSFQLKWVAEDDCHEQLINDTLYQIVLIKDVTKPTAVCTDQLNVSLSHDWGARIYVDDVDANSYDACGIAKREIRIKGTDHAWTEYVNITCEYVHHDLQIEMRVTDIKGNYNICWLDVLVEDKIAPICENLPPATKYCTDFHKGELGESTDADGDRKFEDAEWTDLTPKLHEIYNKYFGEFNCTDNLAGDNCGQLETKGQYQLIEWPCGEIEIKRRHQAIDWTGNKSEYVYQDVKVVYKAGWSFVLPSDADGTCEMAPDANSITINNGTCDLLGYEVTDKRYDVTGDACYKIERTYHIINWCKYVAGDAPIQIARKEGEHGFATGFEIDYKGNEDNGYWTYIQILKVHDNEAPVVTVVNPEPCINAVDFDADPYGEEDQTPGRAPYECDEEKIWTASATDCSDSSAITWIGRLYNSTGDLVTEVNTNTISYVVSNKESYYAEFWAYDGCGNSGGQKGDPVKFWDCKKPTPYLINGVVVEIMETGMIQVWATDLDQGTFDNCTDQSKLDIRIWHANLGDAPTNLEEVESLPRVIDLTCTELGNQTVAIYAIDEEGNWDFAISYVVVQDNMGVCFGNEPNARGMVTGRIIDAEGDNVELVSVAVNGAEDKNMSTAADGQYQFNLPLGGDYTLTPEKDMNPLNGVSTFDLVLISKHILGVSTFDSPYKYIAADVNKSGTITAFDMVQLRQLILNITSEFPNNDSWRFVESGYNFTSSNPAAESFRESMSINNLAANMEDMDFTAIKIGDVNGNALANNFVSAEARTTNGTLTLSTTDFLVKEGQTVMVDFAASNIAQVEGYQFTLKANGSLEIAEGIAKEANFNTQLASRGILTTSWNGTATANDILFSVTFTANTTGLLSELFNLNSDVTTAEAYAKNGELMNVNMNFTESNTGLVLNQNSPNPFSAETTIEFNLPTASAATLKVMDIQGKVLKTITSDFNKGYNQVVINAKELGATGAVYYQLEAGGQTSTKKMIVLE